MGEVLAITFFLLIIPLLVILGVVYFRSRKVYPLMYILSVFSYVNLVAYVIDAFSLQKNGIIGLLSLSAVLLIGLGIWIAKRESVSSLQPVQASKKQEKTASQIPSPQVSPSSKSSLKKK